MLVAVPAVLLGARLVAGASAEAGVAGLQPGLAAAFEQARAAAADAGHRLTITSGFRTVDEQAALLDAEAAERGSLEEALWWVFPPERSMHVQGLAVDVGGREAAEWLAGEGARFGLCRTLAWEWWHFEWRPRWEATGTCPAPAATPEEAPPP
jgi:LAS superfamily LD-carboxypeptidase LdcB